MKPYRVRWRFQGRPLACAFLRQPVGKGFYSLCGRHTVAKIGNPEGRDGKAPPALQRCPKCDSLNGG
jgi:hypothetical protein